MDWSQYCEKYWKAILNIALHNKQGTSCIRNDSEVAQPRAAFFIVLALMEEAEPDNGDEKRYVCRNDYERLLLFEIHIVIGKGGMET